MMAKKTTFRTEGLAFTSHHKQSPLATLALLVLFAWLTALPNWATAKITEDFPGYTLTEEYFGQESGARQACTAFVSARVGYNASPYGCNNGTAGGEGLWAAGWLCETYANHFFNCPAYYFGEFRYRECSIGQQPNRDTGLCGLPPKNKSNGGSSSCGIDIGNPINAATGNKWQHEVDLVGGASGLVFGRYYNASTPAVQRSIFVTFCMQVNSVT